MIKLPEDIQSDINLINDVAKEMQMNLYIVGGLPRDIAFGVEITEETDLDVTEGNGNAFDLAFFVSAKYDLMQPVIYESSGTALVVMQSGRFVEFHNAFYNVPHIIDQLYALKVKPTPINKDIYSRDFTINGLLLDPNNNEIIDITGDGLSDIENRVLRTAIDPNKILKFNPRNILRGIRFMVQFGLTPVPEYEEAVQNHLPELIQILQTSPESKMVQRTVDKTIKLNKDKAMQLYKKYNILPYLPPSIEVQREQKKEILDLNVVAQNIPKIPRLPNRAEPMPSHNLSMQDRLMMDRQKHKEYMYRKKREKRKDRKNMWDIMKKIRGNYYFDTKEKVQNKNTVKDRKTRVFDYIKHHTTAQLQQPNNVVEQVSSETGIPYEKCLHLYNWIQRFNPEQLQITADNIQAILKDVQFMEGLPSEDYSGESVELLNKFLDSLVKSKQDMISIKDDFVEKAEEISRTQTTSSSKTLYKYSIHHNNSFHVVIPDDDLSRSDAILNTLENVSKEGIPYSVNWETINHNKPYDLPLDKIQELWNINPDQAKQYIEEYKKNKIEKKVESYLNRVMKKQAKRTEYGDVPNQPIEKGVFDYSDLKKVWGAAADDAIKMVNKYKPGILDQIRFITITEESGVAGVFETDFNDQIKQVDELNDRQGIGFRISPSKINQEVSELSKNIQDEEMKQIILSLVIAEIIVHEATHANGADDEVEPVEKEREFLQTALTDINTWRSEQNPPLQEIPLLLK